MFKQEVKEIWVRYYLIISVPTAFPFPITTTAPSVTFSFKVWRLIEAFRWKSGWFETLGWTRWLESRTIEVGGFIIILWGVFGSPSCSLHEFRWKTVRIRDETADSTCNALKMPVTANVARGDNCDSLSGLTHATGSTNSVDVFVEAQWKTEVDYAFYTREI